MKKLEKPIFEAVHFNNAFIATSGCSGIADGTHTVGESGPNKGSEWRWNTAENSWYLSNT